MLQKSANTKYLGVLLDNKLNWVDHISKTVEKTNKRLGLMKRLAGAMSGSTQDTLNVTCNMYVKPIIKYGREVIDTANKANLNHLETAQNNALRLIYGAVKTTKVTALQYTQKTCQLVWKYRNKRQPPTLNYKILPGQAGSTNIPHVKLSKPNLHQ